MGPQKKLNRFLDSKTLPCTFLDLFGDVLGSPLGKKHTFPGVSKHESQAFGEGFVDRCLGDIAMFDGLNPWGFLHPRKLT